MLPLDEPEIIEQNIIKSLGIRRITVEELGIKRSKNGFSYVDDSKRTISRITLRRINDLVIPPAWSDVRIAVDKDSHLQAVGRDAAGRLQYIYHPEWVEVRDAAKAFRLLQIGKALGRLRLRIRSDLEQDTLEMPMATAARILDILHLRAGHEVYAGEEGGRGVSTLLKRHLKIDDNNFKLAFRGKGGKPIYKECNDPILIIALKKLRSYPGSRLFKLKTPNGYRPMTAVDLNEYLSTSSGKPITAKDFRTLFASSIALNKLLQAGAADSESAAKRIVSQIAREISAELANTPAVTKKSYIYPRIIGQFESGRLQSVVSSKKRGLSSAESKLMGFLESFKE